MKGAERGPGTSISAARSGGPRGGVGIVDRVSIGKSLLSLPEFQPSPQFDLGGRSVNAGFKIGETKHFSIGKPTINIERAPRSGLRIAQEVSAKKPGEVSSESTPSRRITHHRKISARENSGFRPINYSVRKPEVSSSVKPDVIRSEETGPFVPKGQGFDIKKSEKTGYGILSEKAGKVQTLHSLQVSQLQKVDEVAIPKPKVEEISRLETIVEKVKRDKLGLVAPEIDTAIKYVENKKRAVEASENVFPSGVALIREDEKKKRQEQEKANQLRNKLRKLADIAKPEIKKQVASNPEIAVGVKLQTQLSNEAKQEVVVKTPTAEHVIFEGSTGSRSSLKSGQEKEVKPVLDENAYKARRDSVKVAEEIVLSQSELSGKAPTGADIANLLPENPPEPLVSAILKRYKLIHIIAKGIDGSWKAFLSILRKTEKINNKKKIEDILRSVPPVEIGQGQEVTDEDVKRVTGITDIKNAA